MSCGRAFPRSRDFVQWGWPRSNARPSKTPKPGDPARWPGRSTGFSKRNSISRRSLRRRRHGTPRRRWRVFSSRRTMPTESVPFRIWSGLLKSSASRPPPALIPRWWPDSSCTGGCSRRMATARTNSLPRSRKSSPWSTVEPPRSIRPRLPLLRKPTGFWLRKNLRRLGKPPLPRGGDCRSNFRRGLRTNPEPSRFAAASWPTGGPAR